MIGQDNILCRLYARMKSAIRAYRKCKSWHVRADAVRPLKVSFHHIKKMFYLLNSVIVEPIPICVTVAWYSRY